MTTSESLPEKAWYVPADAIWDDPYWRPLDSQTNAEQ